MSSENTKLNHIVEDFSKSPFWNYLGLSLHSIQEGEVQLHLEVKDDFMNTIHTVHGGVFASVIDTTMGMTARSYLGSPFTTVNLNVHFVKAVSKGSIWSKGKIIAHGKSIFTVQADIFNDENELCAHGTGTFKAIKKR
ncbi:hypothetical protein BTR23_17280 [Alkalihalophilus pseudofirmus]|nr:hypothetical protein BTR23_17280 [Alkalihalophilus pseudofirmus]